MIEIINGYKKEILSKRIVLISIVIICSLGLLFGSLYLTILNNDEKKEVLDVVSNYFYSFNDIRFSDKLSIFKDSLLSNLIYYIIIWSLGISILGLPIIFIMIFFKSFTIGFSIASIFAKYRFKGLIGILVYIFPSVLINLFITVILGTYSCILSIKLVRDSFSKKSLNFGNFMGRYFLLILLIIILVVICSIFDAFISPILYKLFVKSIK